MKLTKEQATLLKLKYGGCCAYCGILLGDRWQKDHIEPLVRIRRYVKDDKGRRIPLGKGKYQEEVIIENPDRDTYDNLNPSCAKCNNDKSSMSLERWRELIPRRVHTLNNDPKYASYQKAKRFGLVVECDIQVVFWFERYRAISSLVAFMSRFPPTGT